MKRSLPLLILLFLAHQVCIAADADAYPQRPIRLVVSSSPGGAADFIGRLLGEKISNALGQNVVVENRPGASGIIAAESVAKSAPDGYTLLLSSITTVGIIPVLYKKLPYDALKDFNHIGLLSTMPCVMVVPQSAPVHSVKEFVAFAKSKPDEVMYGSGGSGSPPQLMAELFKSLTGAPIVHVPYKGTGPAVIDLVGGRLHVMFDGLPSIIGQINSGKLRALATTSTSRSSVLPDVPTMTEAGLPGMVGGLWYGLSGPAGLPPSVIDKLSKAVFKFTALEDVKEQLATVGAQPTPLGPQGYTQFIRDEMGKWGHIIKLSGTTVD